MTQEIMNIIWTVLGTVVTGLVGWGVSVLIAWLNSKIKNEKVKKWTLQLTTIVTGAVQAITQSFVDTLKKNGKFDANAQSEAKEKALQIINQQLTPELKTFIVENYGDIEAYLKEQVETTLYQLKNK